MSSITYNARWEDVLPKLPDKSYYLASCDVPYGINVGNMPFLKEKNTTIKQKNGARINPHKNKQYEFSDWDLIPPPQEYFDELRRVSVHQIIFGVEYVNWEGLGAGRIRWEKGVADNVSFKKYELAYCSFIDYEYCLPLLWSGMMQAKSLKDPMIQQGNKKLNEKRIHPCHKPVMLYDAIYKEFGVEGMSVIDTHLGGGSNRISCDKMGYNFLGIEANKKYFDKEENRYNQYKIQYKMLF